MNEKAYDEKVETLFPAPSPSPTVLCPQRWPGCNLDSLTAVQHVLIDNHIRHHIFTNHIKFHNHITHRALAIYASGGSSAVIEAFYKQDTKVQRAAFVSPHPITAQNFVDHLGDENYYEAYTTFFAKVIEEKGASATLDEFIFSEKYNFQPGRDAGSQPEMLSRFVDAVMHPLIHCGYGVEFGLKGMLAQGLSMTTMHDVHFPGFFPPSMFGSNPSDDIRTTMNSFASLVLDDQSSAMPLKAPSRQDTHAFSIIARVLKDLSLTSEDLRHSTRQYPDTLVAYGGRIREHVQKWTVDLSRPGEIERKMEECIWTSSVMYALGGWRNGFTADFILMHMVTSSIFLPSLIAYLSPRAQVLLLRAYLSSAVTWFVARGRPSLNFKTFFESTLTVPNPPNGTAVPPVEGFPIEDVQTPNPFLPLVQSSIMHPNDHHVKIQRAFAHFSTIYGARPKGYFAGTELEGAEELDGSLFVRAAVLTADYMGWAREGEEARDWSFEGLYA
ncbi:uncharacterized protein EDB93DRAFT_1092359 [Suillus bovinus]|uniref:uncharacterized protein n=1 Tax=Suillus bovinus TaxID=48563 RepID=UPI001B861D74|nr:uncharacterized protein EDB93DRAFT_1092359 [Suillus bovinus]KAG2135389.1 hypothetical protein EDB93DRAFT_1092359 [Suillus bovinus]